MTNSFADIEGFPASDRLRRPSEFRSTFDGGVKVVTSHLVLVGMGTSRNGRIGVVASRKVGNAVARNLAKRRIREFYRKNRHLVGGIDLVVIARPRSVEGESQDADQAFAWGLRKLRKKLEQENSD